MSSEPESVSTPLTPVELELIGFIVGVISLFHIPKSIGEIYGLLYISSEPLSAASLVEKLGISLGSASQGIRTLRSIGAIHSVYVRGDRKEHFVAETDFRTLITRILMEDWKPKLLSITSKLESIEKLAEDENCSTMLNEKIKTLKRLDQKANLVFGPISKILRS